MKRQITIQDVRRKTTKEELRQLKAFFEGHNQPLPWKARKLMVVEAKAGFLASLSISKEWLTENEFLKKLARIANMGFDEAKGCRRDIKKAFKQITGVNEDGGRFSVNTTSMGDDPTMYEYRDANVGVDRRGDEYIRRQSHLDKTSGEHFQRGVNWW